MFQRIWFKGNKYRCNLCNSTVRRFIHEQPFPKNEYICPFCHSTSSSRTLWLYLTNEVIGKKNKNKFLYVGPEQIILDNLKKTDISLDVIGRDYFNSQKFLGNEKMPGGFYDVILLNHQLEYFEDDIEGLSELKRLLRTGGFGLITTLINPKMDRAYENIADEEDRDRLRNYYKHGAKRVYGVNIFNQLSNAGFQVTAIDYPSILGHGAVKYYKLRTGYTETIFKCKKPQIR